MEVNSVVHEQRLNGKETIGELSNDEFPMMQSCIGVATYVTSLVRPWLYHILGFQTLVESSNLFDSWIFNSQCLNFF